MIIELLKRRSSVRNYQDRSIPTEVLQIILEAGRLSPSGGNEQPWLFCVITDAELILPAGTLPAELLVLGYPARAPRSQAKKVLEEMVFYDRYQ